MQAIATFINHTACQNQRLCDDAPTKSYQVSHIIIIKGVIKNSLYVNLLMYYVF